ncbi:hypothetical protein E2C01_093488 [Portunus trituberculatus]|uniref:Uncharacterized protein n=1 Tax=Portunus trituberculatus TaxID=210409 RepID=A0A5B7JUC0_PORTR|nr:hypothetical protein [Portunus trituberculatus]
MGPAACVWPRWRKLNLSVMYVRRAPGLQMRNRRLGASTRHPEYFRVLQGALRYRHRFATAAATSPGPAIKGDTPQPTLVTPVGGLSGCGCRGVGV